MGNDSVGQCWYIFWIIEAIVGISIVGALTVVCRSVFNLLGLNRRKLHSFKRSLVRSLGTLRRYLSPYVSDSKAVNLAPNNTTKRSG
jgi:hypothetical protein